MLLSFCLGIMFAFNTPKHCSAWCQLRDISLLSIFTPTLLLASISQRRPTGLEIHIITHQYYFLNTYLFNNGSTTSSKSSRALIQPQLNNLLPSHLQKSIRTASKSAMTIHCVCKSNLFYYKCLTRSITIKSANGRMYSRSNSDWFVHSSNIYPHILPTQTNV